MEIRQYDLRHEYEELREEILDALDRTSRSAAFVLGEEVRQFEEEFARYCEATHCVALNSGTSALHLALLAVGVQQDQEVITSPNTFFATASTIAYLGAKPVFVDIDRRTANLRVDLVERAITRRTRAILPVHLYGRPAEMDAIREIAERHKLAVIEDACQAHGARYRGRRVGALGMAGAFSFYPSKNLGAYGEGGALVTNDDRVAEYARKARTHGQSARYLHEFIGFNYRMDGYQGAVLRVKMKRLDRWQARRKEIAEKYKNVLEGAHIEILEDDPRDECAYHQFAVYVEQRDAVQAQMSAVGVETVVHYPRPLHMQPAFASLGYPRGSFPAAEQLCERVLCLPMFPGLKDEQVECAATRLRSITG
jgi:dTDP-4-amino-4,6-dideoxygalactose transaminase